MTYKTLIPSGDKVALYIPICEQYANFNTSNQ